MKKAILLSTLCLALMTGYTQTVTVKPNTGADGPIFSAVSIYSILGYTLGPMRTNFGTTPARVHISFTLTGMSPSAYRYNGTSYTLPFYGDGECLTHVLHQSGNAVNVYSKATIVFEIQGKTYTQTKRMLNHNCVIDLPLEGDIPKSDITSSVRITLEPERMNALEVPLQAYEQCVKRKKNEEKAKAESEKEAKGQKNAKKEDDFWSGAEERKLVIVAPEVKTESISNEKEGLTESAYIFLTFFAHDGKNGECWNERAQREGIVTNIFKLPKSATVLHGSIRPDAPHYSKIKDLVKAYYPHYDDSCIAEIIKKSAFQANTDQFNTLEGLERDRQTKSRIRPIKVDDFHPFGK